MAYTQTQVANEALLLIGERPIADIDALDSATAETCRGFWGTTTTEVQSETFWPECLARIEVSADPTDSLDGLFRYALPGDALRVKSVNPDVSCDAFRREGHYIVSGAAAPIVLEYARHLDDPGEWSTHLARCTWTLLAAKLAVPLAHSASIAAAMREQYVATLQDARRRVYSDHTSVQIAPRYYGWRRARR